jgi:hypothetical protein
MEDAIGGALYACPVRASLPNPRPCPPEGVQGLESCAGTGLMQDAERVIGTF